jgi:hypothetical protein
MSNQKQLTGLEVVVLLLLVVVVLLVERGVDRHRANTTSCETSFAPLTVFPKKYVQPLGICKMVYKASFRG